MERRIGKPAGGNEFVWLGEDFGAFEDGADGGVDAELRGRVSLALVLKGELTPLGMGMPLIAKSSFKETRGKIPGVGGYILRPSFNTAVR